MKIFEFYEMYTALKAHFETSYDFVKYKGKMNLSVSNFERRKDVIFFKKWSKQFTKKEAAQFITANLLYDVKWIGDFKKENLSRFRNQLENISYTFSNDLDKMILECELSGNPLQFWFTCVDGNHPPIVQRYLQNKLAIETLIVLNHFLKLFEKFDRDISDTVFWPMIKNKCLKYERLLQFSPSQFEKFKQIIQSKWSSSNVENHDVERT